MQVLHGPLVQRPGEWDQHFHSFIHHRISRAPTRHYEEMQRWINTTPALGEHIMLGREVWGWESTGISQIPGRQADVCFFYDMLWNMCLEKSETEYFPSSRKKLNVRIRFCHHKNLAFPIEQQHAASPDFVTSVASTGRFLFFLKGNWIKIMTNAVHSHFLCMKSLKGSFSEIKGFGR